MDIPNLSITIETPFKLADNFKNQLIDLIVDGGQVSYNYAKVGVHRSHLIGLLVTNDQVLGTCCLKKPLEGYIQNVFKNALAEENSQECCLELGYITTRKGYEGNKLCQKLLDAFIPVLPEQPVFATTRKSAMEHILKKYGFLQIGSVYKDDLKLLIRATP